MATQTGAMTVETDGKQDPAVKRIYTAVYSTMRKLGYAVGHAEDLEGRPGTAFESCGITPADAAFVNSLMWDHSDHSPFVDLGLQDGSAFEGAFGEHYGKEHVTTVFGKVGMTVPEAIEKLEDRGAIEIAVERVRNEVKVRTDVNMSPEEIVAYALSAFATGWVAEKTITEKAERFKKGSISNDLSGQDAYDRTDDQYVQIRPITHGYKRQEGANPGEHTDSNGNQIIYYAYDNRGKIHVGKDHTQIAAKAANPAGMSKTIISQSRGNLKAIKEYEGRDRFRVLWW